MEKNDKSLHICGVIWYKFLPFIPILGIPLTIIYHNKFGNTGIEKNHISWVYAFIQGICGFLLFYYIII